LGRTAIVPLVRDPASLNGAISGATRLWEEYSADKYVILETGVDENVLRILRRWISRLSDNVRVERVPSTLDTITVREDKYLQTLRDILDKHCDEASVLLVSSASRRLAAALSVAALYKSACGGHTIVHNDFYFGPWNGLPYPYTPLRLEPLHVIHPVHDPQPRGPAAGRAPKVLDDTAPFDRRLPPLRATIAELARRLNQAAWTSLVYPRSSGEPRCGKLSITIDGTLVGEADLCWIEDMERLALKLANRLSHMEQEYRLPFRSVLAWTGLANVYAQMDGERIPLAELVTRHRVIADTSLIFYGLHRYYWEGARIEIPDCAIKEVHKRFAESIKKGRVERGSEITAVLAYLGLLDMLWGDPPVVPSPPGDCDTAIPKIDPLILDNKIVATADDGAFRYWNVHPARKLTRPIKAFFDPDEKPSFEAGANRRSAVARLYYSVYQALIVFALLDSQGRIRFEASVRRMDGGEERVDVPVRMILKRLGLEERRERR